MNKQKYERKNYEKIELPVEIVTLALFCFCLLICVSLKLSVLYALSFGLLLFCTYAVCCGNKLGAVLLMCLKGVKKARNIIINLVFIGMMTALWRASGTVSYIVNFGCGLISASLILPMSFLLCCAVSVLTGTAFGTAATMGLICASVASAMGVPAPEYGGAILAGCYFGDRCSPVSTSALLVSELTETSLHRNITAMLKSALLPFLLSCSLYYVVGIGAAASGDKPDLYSVFSAETVLLPVCLAPAALIVLLACFKVKVKAVMLASIAASAAICIFLQRLPLALIAKYAFWGYSPKTEAAKELLSGGGIVSMLKVTAIICISSAYSGIFAETRLLTKLKNTVGSLSLKVSSFGAALLVSIISSCVSCNQTLSIILTHQLIKDTEEDKEKLALILENSATVIAPLVPWSIAGGVPLSSVGAPTVSMLYAFFLYLLPIFCFIRSYADFIKNKKQA